MRYLTLVVIMIFCIDNTYSQTYEVGAYFGGANYIGDIGPTNYIAPRTLAGGVILKWNRSPRHSFRFSIIRANIEANDFNSQEGLRKQRGLFFKNTITEASLGIEYTFWEWDLHSYEPQMTPYLYTGVTYFHSDDLEWENGFAKKSGDNWNFSIPVVIGLKATLSHTINIGVEIGPRFTFTDGLDGFSLTESETAHPVTSDWYMFTGITLTYSFGRKPCYCSF